VSEALWNKAERKYRETGLPITYQELRRSDSNKDHYSSARIHHIIRRGIEEGKYVTMNVYRKKRAVAPVTESSLLLNIAAGLIDRFIFLSERRQHILFVCKECGYSFRRLFPLLRQPLVPRLCPCCGSKAFSNYYRIFDESILE